MSCRVNLSEAGIVFGGTVKYGGDVHYGFHVDSWLPSLQAIRKVSTEKNNVQSVAGDLDGLLPLQAFES